MVTNQMELFIASHIIKDFSLRLQKEIHELRETINDLGLPVSSYIPAPFIEDEAEIKTYYSLDRSQYFFIFNRTKAHNGTYEFQAVTGNPIPTGMFNMTSASEVKLLDVNLKGKTQDFRFEFSFGMSHSNFLMRSSEVRKFAVEIVTSTRDRLILLKEKEKLEHKEYLQDIVQEFYSLITSETAGELKIDNFLQNNPIILESSLNLVKPHHQFNMKNILNIYEHDLKPDLVAFDLLHKQWTIVDYKRANKKLIKNVNKVRTGFKAEVHDLKNQIRDYVEYFQEKEHRDYIEKKYQIKINHPKAVGIIGSIKQNEEKDFNRLINEEPQWYKVIPYNYLFENFSRYVLENQ